jgi:hypothetical protein
MAFAIQQAPMHRAMDEIFGEGAHHYGGNRGADKSDYVREHDCPCSLWFKYWGDRYFSTRSELAWLKREQLGRKAYSAIN